MAADKQLATVVEYMVTQQAAVAAKSRQNGDRPWLDFSDIATVGKFDFAGLHELFTRDDSNDNYARYKTTAGTEAKDVHTAKLSADFLAGLERDHRMRMRSRIRMFVHAGIVTAGKNGLATGPLRSNPISAR